MNDIVHWCIDTFISDETMQHIFFIGKAKKVALLTENNKAYWEIRQNSLFAYKYVKLYSYTKEDFKCHYGYKKK